jgi:hypothetical protein
MRVRIEHAPVLTTSSPDRLFEGDFVAPDSLNANYDVLPDGTFIMLKPTGITTPHRDQIHLITNWPAALK